VSALLDVLRAADAEHPDVADALIREIGEKNTVRVVKYAAVRGPAGLRHRKVEDDEYNNVTMPGASMALVRLDEQRIAYGLKPRYLDSLLWSLGGDLAGVSFNIRTDVGKDFVAVNLGGTQVSVADYIALSNNNGGTSASHTGATLPWSGAEATDAAAGGARGEYTALGLQRAQGTFAHTTNTTSYTIAKTFTASSTITNVQIAGLFGGSTKSTQGSSATTNILFLENTFTATTLAASDQIAITWTVNI
jgi:hypothetical protein